MTKILHISDTHFGGRRDGTALTCLKAAFAIAEEKGVDYIVHAGELWDRAVMNTALSPLSRVMDIYSLPPSVTAKIIVRGTPSHDVAGSLDLLKPYAEIAEEPRRLRMPSVDFILLPEPSKAVVAGEGDPNRAFSEWIVKTLEGIKGELNPESLIVLVGHLAVAGATTASEWGLTATLSPRELLDLSGADAAMLGHVHKAQTFCDGRVRYSGSICHLDFGDKEPEKGCWLWEFDGKDIVNVEWIKLPSRRLLTIGHEEIEELLKIDPITVAEVKIRIPEEKAKDKKTVDLLKILSEQYSIQIEWVPAESKARIRSEAILKAKTLTEEIEEWAQVSGVKLSREIGNKIKMIEGPE